MGCFSFYPGKNLGACGEGGMVVTNNEDYAQRIRMLRDWGQERKYHHTLKGFNYRLEGVQGAMLRVKLRHLDAWTEGRRKNADHYKELLAGSGITIPVEAPYARHVYHVYGIRVPDRDAVQAALQARDIQTGIHYPIPVHLQKAYQEFGFGPGDLPVTEKASAELLSLPMFPELARSQVEEVCDALLNAVGRAV
jgi:dTDP-4-amino-4,6-dideoxygalactose transaminase